MRPVQKKINPYNLKTINLFYNAHIATAFIVHTSLG